MICCQQHVRAFGAAKVYLNVDSAQLDALFFRSTSVDIQLKSALKIIYFSQ